MKIVGDIRYHLLRAHRQENAINTEMTKIDKQILQLQKRKNKLAKMVSSNMKWRNRLINQL